MGGKSDTIIRRWKYYTIADVEKEEQYLTQMASKGWRFVDTNGFLYTFEKCEPENVAYRLDYSGIPLCQRDDYYAMFRDYGWEYLQDINGFSYFRKSADGVSPDELELFSDGESHLKMIRKFLCAKLPLIFIMFFACMMINVENIRNIINKVQQNEQLNGMDGFFLFILLFLIFEYIFITVNSIYAYFRMKKRYQKGA